MELLIRDPEEPGSYILLTYKDVTSCGTHEGCRWHDWCFDRCVEIYDETLRSEVVGPDVATFVGPCHSICNARAEYYGTVATAEERGPTSALSAFNWFLEEGPFDRYWLFAEKVEPSRFDGGETEIAQRGLKIYPDDFTDDPYGVSTYEIIFYTGRELGAGTDAKIHLELIGEKNGETTQSGPFFFDGYSISGDALSFLSDADSSVVSELRSTLGIDTLIGAGSAIADFALDQIFFEAGSKNSFFRTGPEIGELEKIVVGHDNSGIFAPWYLDRVTIIDTRSRKTWTANVDRWISEDSGTLSLTVSDIREESLCLSSATLYLIDVKTKSEVFAGTDSKISIELIGNCGGVGVETYPVHLDTPGNNFEMGDYDQFLVVAGKVGELSRITIHHDGSGIGPAWDCDYVNVRDLVSGRHWVIDVDDELDDESNTYYVNA